MEENLANRRTELYRLSSTASFFDEYKRARNLLDKDCHSGYDSILSKLIDAINTTKSLYFHANPPGTQSDVNRSVVDTTLQDELEANNNVLNIVDRTAELLVNNTSQLSPARKKKLVKKKKNSSKTTTTVKASLKHKRPANQETIDVSIQISQTTSNVNVPCKKQKKRSSASTSNTSTIRRSFKKLTENLKSNQQRIPIALSTCEPSLVPSQSHLIPSTPKTVKLTHFDSANANTVRAVANNYVQSTLSSVVKQAPSVKMLESIQDSITASGKVKHMIELVEARVKHSNNNTTFNSAQKVNPLCSNFTPGKSKLASVRKLHFPPSAIKKVSKDNQTMQPPLASKNSQTSLVGRSSIDQRKLRTSNAKAEVKRQSTKKLNSIINDIVQTKSEPVDVEEPSHAESQSTAHVYVKQEPFEVDGVQNNQGNLTSFGKQPNLSTTKIKKALTDNIAIQHQYRIVSNSQMSSTVLQSNSKLNVPVAKSFLDRNTPCKLTKSEIEDKKKAELASKEKKDQERLVEREKLLQEKVENAKKKREEQMKKIEEFKIKKLEEEQKRKEDLDAKLEEQKKRVLEEKRKEELEKNNNLAKMKESHQPKYPHHTAYQSGHLVNMSNNMPTPIHNSTVIIDTKSRPNLAGMQSTQQGVQNQGNVLKTISNNQTEYLSTFKGGNSKTPLINKSNSKINQPHSAAQNNAGSGQHNSIKTQMPSNFMKKKIPENYDVADLKSDDETDDEEEPSKPIPSWARDPLIRHTAIAQSFKFINFTKLFKSASKTEIVLENIFKTRNEKFQQRSSSANWSSPPIWASNGITGDESFMQLKNAMK